MPRGDSGVTLVEVLVAVVLLSLGLLAAAPMFVYGTRVTASSGDLGKVGGEAVRRMEILRQTAFNAVPVGGSLSTSAAGFYEARPEAVVRWTVTATGSPPSEKTITVRAAATRRVIGLEKQVTFITRRFR